MRKGKDGCEYVSEVGESGGGTYTREDKAAEVRKRVRTNHVQRDRLVPIRERVHRVLQVRPLHELREAAKLLDLSSFELIPQPRYLISITYSQHNEENVL